MPAPYNLIVDQGDTWRREFTWKPGGVPCDLTGYTARMQIRPNVSSSTIIAELSTTPTGSMGTITLGGAAGTINLLLAKEQTLALDFTGAPTGVVEELNGKQKLIATGLCASYDLEITSAGGERLTLIRGLICLAQEVTR